MDCQQCGKKPTDAERVVIDHEMAKPKSVKPTGWICTGCRPAGFPADGLCYSIVDIGGESPDHEYEG